jgi:hypothetical protein
MLSRTICTGLLAGAAAFVLLGSPEASAHGFAGSRFFPATLVTDDPFVADELALPTIAHFKDEGDVGTTTYSADFAKRLTANFGVEFGASYVQLRPPGGPAVDGFDNISVGAKYQVLVDAPHETILAIGVDTDVGGTGAKRIGADDFSTISPTFFFGKGFGDLADQTSLLRPFAGTGSLGVEIPNQSHSPNEAGGFEEHPTTLAIGLALEYSLPYLQSQVRNVGLGAPFDRMIPLVEFSFETPLNRGGGESTGTINPGLLWAGQYIQLGAEAIIPMNRASGHAIGFIAQLHFYIDDLLPASFGRPLFGG